MKPDSYHHGDLKAALLQAAREILRKQGPGGLSLRAIAAAIGVSHMAPYAHFKSKSELLQAVAAAGFDELAERMLEAKRRTLRGRNLAISYGIEYIQFALENPAFYQIMMSHVSPPQRPRTKTVGRTPPDPIAEKIRIRSQRPFKLLHAAFTDRNTSRRIALARALGAWSMVHGMATLIIDGHLIVPAGMEAVDLFKAAVGAQRE